MTDLAAWWSGQVGETFARAITLPERLLGGVAAPLDNVNETPSAAGGAEQAPRWRAIAELDDDARWSARLAALGLDEAGLRDLLAEGGADVFRRMPTPWWAGVLARVLTDADVDGEADTRSEADVKMSASLEHDAAMPFLPFVAPWLRYAYPLVRDGIAAAGHDPAGGGRLPFSPAYVAAALLGSALRPRLHGMVLRTMLLELAIRRADGLTGDDPQARLASFTAELSEASRRSELLTAYPVLARQLAVVTTDGVASAIEFGRRLASDWTLLADTFCAAGELGSIVEVTCRLGDPHRRGRSVAMVRFSSGLRLIYKPRPVTVDIHFQELLRWLNERGERLALRTLTLVDRGEYGWSEYAAAAVCHGEAERRRFHRRQGALLAVLHVVHANDFHSENLIAAGEHPVLVDLETLFQPTVTDFLPGDESPAERLAAELVDTSVLSVGLLPAASWQARDGASLDVSAIGARPSQVMPVRTPHLVEAGTDRMRLGLDRMPSDDSNDHRPAPADEPSRLLDYSADVTAGFADTYRLLSRYRDALGAPDGPLAAFVDDEVRVVPRPTMRYALLLDTSYHPDVLRDALDRDRHFDRLWSETARFPGLANIVACEQRDLWTNDIPVFTGLADGHVVRDSTGAPVAVTVATSGMDNVRAVLLAMSEDHLVQQVSLVEATLATAAVRRGDTMRIAHSDFVPARRPATTDELVAAAGEIVEYLAKTAIRADDDALWIGPQSGRHGNWWVGPLGPGLFNGLLGIALFLAVYAAQTGDTSARNLAAASTRTALRQLHRGLPGEFGGLTGLGGVAYALAHLDRLVPIPGIAEAASHTVARLREAYRRDMEYDVVAGSAGTLLGVAALRHGSTRGLVGSDTEPARPDVAGLIADVADHLLAHAQRTETGIGWLPRSLAEDGIASQPLTGLGHGGSGVAVALLAAADVLGEERYAHGAGEALAYERTLFDPATGAWRDVRNLEAAAGRFEVEPGTPTVTVAWCHGAAGIGLARELFNRRAPDATVAAECHAALRLTRRDGFGTNHSLCHGDLGNLELLTTAAKRGNDGLHDEARRHAATVLADIDDQGWQCGLPKGIRVPGLFTGLAGIGYGLLRVADPDRVPSVLTMDPPAD